MPSISVYYLWSFKEIKNLLLNINKTDVVKLIPEEVNKILCIYKKRWRKLLALILAIVYGCFQYKTRFGLHNGWTSSAFTPIITSTSVSIFAAYMTNMIGITLFNNVLVLNQVLGCKDSHVDPLHPDKCGGLKILSQYSLKTAYLIGILGVMFGLIEYQFIVNGPVRQASVLHFFVALYFTTSLAVFFGPLLVAH